MEEIFCKVCGYIGGVGETECPECGAPLHPVERTPEPETATPEEVYITKETEKKKRGSTKGRKARWAACFLAACLLLQGAGLWLLGRGDRMFLTAGGDWCLQWNGELVTPEGVFPLPQTAYAQGIGIGRRAVIVDRGAYLYGSAYTDRVDATQVYYYDGHTIQLTDWLSGYLNGDATVLFFTRREGEDYVLSRRELERDRTEELLRSREPLLLDGMATDGSALTCYTWEDSEERSGQNRWLWSRRAGTIPVEAETAEAREYTVKLGRNGDNRLVYRFDEPGPDLIGDAITMVDWGRRGIRTELPDNGNYITDRDLTQVIYRDPDGVWRYEDETGRTAEIAGLEEVETLDALVPGTRGAWLGQSRLTPWVYEGSDNHLYRIGNDLQATDLTPEGEVERAFIHPEGKELCYSPYSGGVFHIERPLKRNWETRQLSERLGELTVSVDLSTRAMKTIMIGGQVCTQILIDEGEPVLLEHARQAGWVYCLNGGGCWYEGVGHELWFWSRETGEQKIMGPGNSATVTGVGDGGQALLSLTSYPEGETQTDYWLLDNKGNATRLEVREDGIAGAEDQDGADWRTMRFGAGGALSSVYIPVT